jgi:hypothetical protein
MSPARMCGVETLGAKSLGPRTRSRRQSVAEAIRASQAEHSLSLKLSPTITASIDVDLPLFWVGRVASAGESKKSSPRAAHESASSIAEGSIVGGTTPVEHLRLSRPVCDR